MPALGSVSAFIGISRWEKLECKVTNQNQARVVSSGDVYGKRQSVNQMHGGISGDKLHDLSIKQSGSIFGGKLHDLSIKQSGSIFGGKNS